MGSVGLKKKVACEQKADGQVRDRCGLSPGALWVPTAQSGDPCVGPPRGPRADFLQTSRSRWQPARPPVLFVMLVAWLQSLSPAGVPGRESCCWRETGASCCHLQPGAVLRLPLSISSVKEVAAVAGVATGKASGFRCRCGAGDSSRSSFSSASSAPRGWLPGSPPPTRVHLLRAPASLSPRPRQVGVGQAPLRSRLPGFLCRYHPLSF